MPSRSRLLLGLLATVVAALTAAAPASADLYFSTAGSSGVKRADGVPRGGAAIVAVPGSKANRGAAPVAIAGSALFYNGPGQGGMTGAFTTVMRQPLGGEAGTILRRDDFGSVRDLATGDRWLYYRWEDGIGRVRPDAARGPYTVWIPAAIDRDDQAAIAVDDDGIYWLTGDGRSISRADLDGGDVRHGWITLSGAGATRLAAAGGHLFWIGRSADGRADVGRARIRGDRAEDVEPRFLASRGAARQVYFALAADSSGLWFWGGPEDDDEATSIGWASLDGSDVVPRAIPLAAGVSVGGMASAPLGAELPIRRIDFGRRDLGSGPSEVRTIPLRNTGEAPLTVAEAEVVGGDAGDFTVSESCTSRPVPAGGTCDLRVAFAPRRAGDKRAALRVRTDAPRETHTVALSGDGIVGAAAVRPGGRAFGAVRIGSPVDEVFVVENRQDRPLELAPARIAGRDPSQFRVVDDGCRDRTLDPGQACSIDVAFAPTAMRRASATLRVHKADGAWTGVEAVLNGTGVTPRFVRSPGLLRFEASDAAAEPVLRTAEAVNEGNAPLRIDAVTVTGRDASAFTIVRDGCSDRAVAPQRTCAVEVAFDPSGPSDAHARLTFADDAPGAPHEVLLTGEVRGAGGGESGEPGQPGEPGGGGTDPAGGGDRGGGQAGGDDEPRDGDRDGADDPRGGGEQGGTRRGGGQDGGGSGGEQGGDQGGGEQGGTRRGGGQDGGGRGGEQGGGRGDSLRPGREQGGRGRPAEGGAGDGTPRAGDGSGGSAGGEEWLGARPAPACRMVDVTMGAAAQRRSRGGARRAGVVAVRFRASGPARLLATRVSIAWTTVGGRTRVARRTLPARRVGTKPLRVRWQVRGLAPGTEVRVRVATHVQPTDGAGCLVQPRKALRATIEAGAAPGRR